METRIAVKVPTGGQGGLILLATDVNANVGSGLCDHLAARLRTWYQRRFRQRLVDRVVLNQLAKAGIGTGWSIGPILDGRYYDPETAILYVELSFWVEILDAPYPVLKAIANDLRADFKQQEVLLKSYDTGAAEHLRAAAGGPSAT